MRNPKRDRLIIKPRTEIKPRSSEMVLELFLKRSLKRLMNLQDKTLRLAMVILVSEQAEHLRILLRF